MTHGAANVRKGFVEKKHKTLFLVKHKTLFIEQHFVFIHPYMDGNGRLSRFLMNYLLTTGGYPWTIVTVQSRTAYLAALEQASTYRNIKPFVDLICGLIESQAAEPIDCITRRPESGSWTLPPPGLDFSHASA